MKTELRFTSLQRKSTKKNIQYVYPWIDKREKTKIIERGTFYHWDDKKKRDKDFKKIKKYHAKIILKIITILNKHHKVNFPIRFWRIILGPWLWWFIDTVYERYQALDSHLKNNTENKYFSFLPKKNTKLFPKSAETMSNYYFSEEWTEQIFLKIIKYFFSNKVNIFQKKLTNHKINKFIINEDKIYKNQNKNINNFYRFISKRQKFLICKDTFSFIEEMKLNYKLGSIPNIKIPKDFTLSQKLDHDLRNKVFFKKKLSNDKFENFIFKIIGEEIPTTFLENFKNLYNHVDQLSLPKKPLAIFDSIHLYFVTLMMFYVAKKIYKYKTKLYYFQHGTENGISANNFNEGHEISISDKYFTWGWKSKTSKVKPYRITHNIEHHKKIDYKKNNKILFILRTSQLFFRSGSSLIGYKNWKKYLKDTINFPNYLNNDQLKNLIVRFGRPKFKGPWDEENLWKKRWKNINFDYRSIPIIEQLKKSKIAVCSYNSTLFLECMAGNFPVVMFMPKQSYDLRPDAKKHFTILYKNKIVFNKIEELGMHLNNLDDISAWWSSKDIQEIRKSFCLNYADTKLNSKNLLNFTNLN